MATYAVPVLKLDHAGIAELETKFSLLADLGVKEEEEVKEEGAGNFWVATVKHQDSILDRVSLLFLDDMSLSATSELCIAA